MGVFPSLSGFRRRILSAVARGLGGMHFAQSGSIWFHKEGHEMHDPALWTSWYVVLLLFPFMIIVLLLSDYLAGRGRR